MIQVSDRHPKHERPSIPGSLEAWKCSQCSPADLPTHAVATTVQVIKPAVIDLTEDSDDDDDLIEITPMDAVAHPGQRDLRAGIDAGFSRPHVISTQDSPQGPREWQEQQQEQPHNTVSALQHDMRYGDISQSRFQPYIPNQYIGATVHALQAADKEYLRNLFPPTRQASTSTSPFFLNHAKSPPNALAPWISLIAIPKTTAEKENRPRKILAHRNQSQVPTSQLFGLGEWQALAP
ncbi:hypothetical protein CPB86DRAFT_782855 [Serendipita vermifera]|nr:hypothetical protein CPB86DRAFT_782855 [Serendipita vermifera]